MSIFSLLSYIKPNKKPEITEVRNYDINFNEEKVDGWVCKWQRNHFKQNNILRRLKHPLNETLYLFKNKKGINTYGFRQSYDIVICDKHGKVLDTFSRLDNNFTSKYYKEAFLIYVCPAGFVEYFGVKEKDRLMTIRQKTRSRLIF